jgi:predicted site-specific integrase-resolvase
MSETGKKLLTRTDVAKRLDVSTKTVSRYVKTGRLLPPVARLKVLRWIEDDFEKWLRRR